MILTDKELRDLREVLDTQSGLNTDLLQQDRLGSLMKSRLRGYTTVVGQFGTQMSRLVPWMRYLKRWNGELGCGAVSMG